MAVSDPSRHRAHMPEGTQCILNTRSLHTAHRRLAEILRPGMQVLDVGCGTGAITEGIAKVTGPTGLTVGVDINPTLIRQPDRHAVFAVADLYRLPFLQAFDIVTAARVLQWLSDPGDAVRALCSAARSGGTVLILDYNHEKIVWDPDPPASMLAFYRAFLKWRAEAGMDNTIADRIATLFSHVGLVDIRITPQHEVSHRQDATCSTGLGIWAEVAATRGRQMVSDGAVTEAHRAAAETEYRAWISATAVSQTLYLLAVEGRVPAER